MQLYVKAIWAGAIAFLADVGGALIALDGGFGDLPTGVWVLGVVLGLTAFGGILGWQAAPASVSTSIHSST
jgi:hypothetical protein